MPLLIAAALAFPIALFSQTTPPTQQAAPAAKTGEGVRTFTLEECLKIATSDNLDVKDALARVETASANARQAWGQYLPSADVTLGYSRSLHNRTGQNFGGAIVEFPVQNPDAFFASGSINYTVFNGFARENTDAQSQASYLAADRTAQQTRRRIMNVIRSQYMNVLRTKQIVKVRGEDFEVGKKQLERVRAQFEAGVVPIAPVYTQEADVANRELTIVQAENDYEIAKGTLLASLGMNPTMPAEFQDVQIPQAINEADIKTFRASVGDYGSATSGALQKRLDYAAAQSSIEAANAGVKAASAAWYPSVGASFRYQWFGNSIANFNQFSTQTLGATVTYTIFDQFRRDTDWQRAQVQLNQADIQKRQTEQRISTDVQNAYTQLAAAEKSLDITARSLKSAEQNFNAAEERFKVGAANILDYTTANGTLITARINRLNAIYNYVAAQYQVRFALGTLDE